MQHAFFWAQIVLTVRITVCLVHRGNSGQVVHPIGSPHLPNFGEDGNEETRYDLANLPFETDLGNVSGGPNEFLIAGLGHFWPFDASGYRAAESLPPLDNITRKKPFIWVHIHKAGGTFVCQLAQLAGEVLVQPRDGACNWKNKDQYRSSGPGTKVSCEERASYFSDSKHNFTWAQIEREFDESDRCWDDFEYGVMLREPVDLLQSEINYHPGCTFASLWGQHCGGGPDHPRKFLQELNETLAKDASTGGTNQFPLWKFFDNFQTRILAPAIEVPPGQINSTHVKLAKQALAKFKIVTRLADLPEHGEELVETLGWKAEILSHLTEKVNPQSSDYTFSDDEVEWLREVNKWDMELYDTFAPRGTGKSKRGKKDHSTNSK